MYPNQIKKQIRDLENEVKRLESEFKSLKMQTEKAQPQKKKPVTPSKPKHCCDCRNTEKSTKTIQRNHIHQKVKIPTGKTWGEILSKKKDNDEIVMLQKAVRDARAEKEEAQREAALQSLALDKMRVLLEAKMACDRHRENSIANAERRIKELLEDERRNEPLMELEAAIRQFRSDSPTLSTQSFADPTDISSIPEYSFLTI